MEHFDDNEYNCEDLRLVKRLGAGNKSVVFLAVDCETKNPCAVKVMRKEEENGHKLATTEREILSSLDHPFLPSLLNHFESEKRTFLAIKYCCGGDINRLRNSQPDRTFSESTIRFYAAEVVAALEYLHEQRIVYRDLKPENILVQENGHIMLTDFDLSLRLMSVEYGNEEKEYSGATADSVAGTVEYIAPEVLWGKPYSYSVDWWSLGVLLYEMSHGNTPFNGSDRKGTFLNILSREPCFTRGTWELKALIRQLLVKEPSKRLGSSAEVKDHPFFHGLRWNQLEFVSRPPFLPPTDIDIDIDDDNDVLQLEHQQNNS